MIKLTATNGKVQYNQDEYVIDTIDELDDILKTRSSEMGSTCFVIATS